jgi:DNA invertase Pin-like site-specific DNA recombinase
MGGMSTRPAPTGRDLAYARISLDTEASGSIAKQREQLAAYVVSRGRDAEAVEWFTDESVSGSKVAFRDRPAGGRLWRTLRAGDRVLVTKIDRAARSVRDLLALVEYVHDAGASITFVGNDLDTGSSSGRLMLTILGAIAEFEASLISERRRESLESFSTEGRHAVGKAPIGFLSAPNPAGRGLVIVKDPETAPLVRDAVLRVLAGEPQSTVRESLGLSSTGFQKLLRNPRLAGMTPRNGGVVLVNGVPLVNPDAAILSLAEWQRLDAFMSRNDGKAWSRHVGYGRALACGECGERLYLQRSDRRPEYNTYKCRKPAGVHPKDAPGVGIIVTKVEPHVESEFLSMWGSEPYRVAAVTEDDSARREAVAAANVRVTELERRMRGAERSERRRLNTALMAAYDALDEAEAIPTERREVVSETGQTIGEVWAEADQTARERIVCAFGRFVVKPGRAPLAERVAWDGLTPDSVRLAGEPARVVLVDAPEAEQADVSNASSRIVPAGLRVEIRPA